MLLSSDSRSDSLSSSDDKTGDKTDDKTDDLSVALENVELEIKRLENPLFHLEMLKKELEPKPKLKLKNNNSQKNSKENTVTIIKNMDIDKQQDDGVSKDIGCGSIFADCCCKLF